MKMDQGFTDGGDGDMQTPEEEPYGFMERELIFKLLASHALRDKEFYFRLRDDARGAAEELHIALTEEDVDYIQNQVEWERIDAVAEDVRESLHFELVTHSW